MKKGFLGLLFVVGFSIAALAQPKAVEGMAEFQGKKVPAAVLELPYPTSTVDDAIVNHFAEKGYKASKAKDYQVFRSVGVGRSKTPYDVYVKSERKSRREKESSVVYIVLAKPNEVLSSGGAADKSSVNDGKEFLNDFTPYLEDFNLGLEIAAQEDIIKKLEKKQTTLLSDSTDLNNRKLQLDQKILENSTALQQQQAEIEKQRLALEATKKRRRQ
ncbi:hypothetical protein [Flavihumibacter profundi]|jgi:hypothetical protein|uniref:hypothetical protein n=1 Tax=Flavihumibacter profundi TaxID=2716883 RepID=UPI001CC708C7|nr:hypothetical protein [Flavihumibacter profundi]MBZ5858494.1 hypothetical protein [Flavihumibacter profundi]